MIFDPEPGYFQNLLIHYPQIHLWWNIYEDLISSFYTKLVTHEQKDGQTDIYCIKHNLFGRGNKKLVWNNDDSQSYE